MIVLSLLLKFVVDRIVPTTRHLTKLPSARMQFYCGLFVE